MSTPLKWGSEFLVNTTTARSQLQPTITALPDGRFVFAWTDDSQSVGGKSSADVRVQIFNADGSKSGGEFVVNTTTLNAQSEPTITTLAEGRFVVAWTDESESGGDQSGWAVRAQVFNPDGSKSGGEFLVNTSTAGNQFDPAITALPNGRFVVAWADESESGGDTSGRAIRAQIFKADGTKAGTEFLVNTTTTNFQSQPTITALADGRFVVAWTDGSQTGGDTSGFAVRAQVFNPNGSTSGSEFLVNTTTSRDQIVPTITALADGRFVVAWGDESKFDTSSFDTRAQVFNPNGSKSGAEFLVNTTTQKAQGVDTITALPDGRFVIAWTDESETGGDTSSAAIRAQVFNPDGSKSGAEFLVNKTTLGAQSEATITILADGRFVVGWRDHSETGGDTSGSAVRGQIFDPRLDAVILNGTLADDHYFGTKFDDIMRGRAGDDLLEGGGGNDRLLGGSGDDVLKGGGGDDLLRGQKGADKLLGGRGNDTLIGASGNDVANGGGGDDFLRGGSRDDKLLGGGGNDELFGDRGDDLLKGGGGDDVLDGGAGNDRLFGGPGADLFAFAPGHGTALIADFEDGIDDLDLTAFGFATVQEAKSFASNVNGDVVFEFSGGELLTVSDMSKAQLGGGDILV